MDRCFTAVWTEAGKCPSDERHFKGAAKEIYSYLKLLAKNHGGFVFCGVDNIVDHTKNWKRRKEPFSKRQCERVLRMFRELGVLGDRETRLIHGRSYRGWQFGGHEFWAENHGGLCEFKYWEPYEMKHRKFMGHKDNVGGCVGGGVSGCVGDLRLRDGDCDGGHTDAAASNLNSGRNLHSASVG